MSQRWSFQRFTFCSVFARIMPLAPLHFRTFADRTRIALAPQFNVVAITPTDCTYGADRTSIAIRRWRRCEATTTHDFGRPRPVWRATTAMLMTSADSRKYRG